MLDDANFGVDPSKQSLAAMGKAASVGLPQWAQLFGVFGIGATGVALIVAAILDPEPTSKLGLIVGTGGFLLVTGGLGGIRVLTGLKPKSVVFDGEKKTIGVSWRK